MLSAVQEFYCLILAVLLYVIPGTTMSLNQVSMNCTERNVTPKNIATKIKYE